MRLGIIGSRDFHDYYKLESIIDEFLQNQYEEIEFIVSGGAIGADTLAYRYAQSMAVPIMVLFPKWKELGKSAGIKRNILLVNNCDVIFAFWNGVSKGTKHIIEHAHTRGDKIVNIIRYT